MTKKPRANDETAETTGPRIVGYARVFVKEKNFDEQITALTDAGCSEIVKESRLKTSQKSRPVFSKTLDSLKPGDIILITDIARLSRSIFDLLALMGSVVHKGAILRSINEPFINTDTESGKLTLSILASLADATRKMSGIRTTEGRFAAIAEGGRIGRRTLMKQERIDEARQLRNQGWTLLQIAKALGVDESTISRNLK